MDKSRETDKWTLDNTEEAIQNWRSRDTDNRGNTRRRKTKQKHNTICIGHHYVQTNTNNVNKTSALSIINISNKPCLCRNTDYWLIVHSRINSLQAEVITSS